MGKYSAGVLTCLLAVAILSFGSAISNSQPAETTITYSDFLQEIDRGTIKTAFISEGTISGERQDNTPYYSAIPANQTGTLIRKLAEKNVPVLVRPAEEAPSVLGILANWVPLFLFSLILSAPWVVYWLFFKKPRKAQP